ncbi:uncharacterized protein LOC129410327 isoform X2 [Boleophthalmus pectinirostris]|uniref:uncharacterized protein LOC129410327 isoform X2 n=1 Tax=Boleophthalmus pectinirostris TaxID=150288 RepID=UPI00242E5E99|nr:uncharacterized protein LOC129410327 isoform X2 [Boleophthalmus pectinirostris]
MRIFLIVASFFISVLEATHVQQVSGHTGDELSIHCFSHWTSNGSNSQYTMIFCKGPCSNENLLVKKNESGIIQRGRYKMENSTALFSVTIRRLNRTDAGRYFCELQLNDSVLYQEVLVTVLEGTPAPFVSVPNDITVQTATLSWDYLSSSTVPPVSTSGGSDKKPTSSLTDTTVVIIVSVSLALLVCAIIPLIFYRHWRSSGEEQTVSTGGNKPGVGHRDEHIDVPLAQTAVALQTDPDLEAPDAAQYASVYQALDPQSLD